MTEAQRELKQAQAHLATLQEELPQFHGLLTKNEQEAQKLRAERADLDAQAQTRGRVSVARELLEQHQSDIQSAKVELERLEQIVARERVLDEMAEQAREAARQRKELEKAFEVANTALLKHLGKIDSALGAMVTARKSFLATGGQVSPAFNVTHYPKGWTQEKIAAAEAAGRQALQEIEARGADTKAVLSPYAYELESPFDVSHPDKLLSPEPFGLHLYDSLVQTYRKHKFGLIRENS
jgi:chromosome segregation ATPase